MYGLCFSVSISFPFFLNLKISYGIIILIFKYFSASQFINQEKNYLFNYSLGLVWFGWFYGISAFVGYLMPNPFLCK